MTEAPRSVAQTRFAASESPISTTAALYAESVTGARRHRAALVESYNLKGRSTLSRPSTTPHFRLRAGSLNGPGEALSSSWAGVALDTMNSALADTAIDEKRGEALCSSLLNEPMSNHGDRAAYATTARFKRFITDVQSLFSSCNPSVANLISRVVDACERYVTQMTRVCVGDVLIDSLCGVQQELRQSQEEAASLRQTLEKTTKEVLELREKCTSQSEDIHDLEAFVDELRATIAVSAAEAGGSRPVSFDSRDISPFANAVREMTRTLSHLRQDNVRLASRVNDQLTQLEIAETERGELVEKVQTLSAEQIRIKATLQGMKSYVEELEVQQRFVTGSADQLLLESWRLAQRRCLIALDTPIHAAVQGLYDRLVPPTMGASVNTVDAFDTETIAVACLTIPSYLTSKRVVRFPRSWTAGELRTLVTSVMEGFTQQKSCTFDAFVCRHAGLRTGSDVVDDVAACWHVAAVGGSPTHADISVYSRLSRGVVAPSILFLFEELGSALGSALSLTMTAAQRKKGTVSRAALGQALAGLLPQAAPWQVDSIVQAAVLCDAKDGDVSLATWVDASATWNSPSRQQMRAVVSDIAECARRTVEEVLLRSVVTALEMQIETRTNRRLTLGISVESGRALLKPLERLDTSVPIRAFCQAMRTVVPHASPKWVAERVGHVLSGPLDDNAMEGAVEQFIDATELVDRIRRRCHFVCLRAATQDPLPAWWDKLEVSHQML